MLNFGFIIVLCEARKTNSRVSKSQPQNYQFGAPMYIVATDILGPFPQSESGNRYVLLVGDYFTRWIEAYVVPKFSAKTVAQTLVYEFFSRFGTLFDLHSDQGRNYESQLFKEVCELLEVRKTLSSPYHPQSNGMIERFNRTLIDMTAVYTNQNQTHLDKHLAMLTAAYQSCVHEKTGYTPNLLMLGREVNLELVLGATERSKGCTEESQYVLEMREKLSVIF